MARRLSDFHAALAIRRTGEIVGREEYLDYMTFQRQTRPLFTEIFGPLVGLKEEWADQGATPEELDFSAWRYRYAEDAQLPVATGFIGGQKEQILEETDDHVIARDGMGRTVKLSKKAATIALPLDHPVADADDWAKMRPHFEFSDKRLAADWKSAAEAAIAEGKVTTISIPGGYDGPRALMGDEALAYAWYEQPEMIADMLDVIGETACKVIDTVTAEVQVDQIFVHEDMAGRSGPMVGPRQVDEFIAPYYRRVWELASSRGARLFKQDSDGDMNPVIPSFIAAGINFIYPLEPAAGMDPVAVRREYGRELALMGGLDKHVLRRGTDAIDAELERKIPPLMEGGAVCFGLDHRIPNGTPLEAYRHYVNKAWEIMDRESERLGL